ncbi:MAG: hypothetical protein Q8922_06175 [Bacteroidota bacterium]|nr:hypothetical protein [Bacteroidota bacterium]MDP4233744.1 hypothetical protein [Bacteroidota bacterium]MDP4242383.1 hypothetical protein [Bacteroidota bacterium]MDP4287505.1 hypothetical protein [Bacteroidota bacterium]
MFNKLGNTYSFLLTLILLTVSVSSCDNRRAGEIRAARNFAGSVVRNDIAARDSMIATAKLQAAFANDSIGGHLRQWFGTFCDSLGNRTNSDEWRLDADRDLRTALNGALIDTAEIEETGTVRVSNGLIFENPSSEPFFWMVRQRGKPWRVAFVTMGDTTMDFRQ